MADPAHPGPSGPSLALIGLHKRSAELYKALTGAAAGHKAPSGRKRKAPPDADHNVSPTKKARHTVTPEEHKSIIDDAAAHHSVSYTAKRLHIAWATVAYHRNLLPSSLAPRKRSGRPSLLTDEHKDFILTVSTVFPQFGAAKVGAIAKH